MRFLLLVVSVLFLSACETMTLSNSALPASFTTDNIMKVHQGMTSKEIVGLFGKPKNVSQAVCGSDTGKAWTCTTWEYGKFPYGTARFTFSGNTSDSLILNDFKVDREQAD
jgi:hypothetical protein